MAAASRPASGPLPNSAGTCAAGVRLGDTDYVYLLKGVGPLNSTVTTQAATLGSDCRTPRIGLSDRGFADGSSLTCDPVNRIIYAAKGSTSEFYSFGLDNNVWTTRKPLPVTGSHRARRRFGSGSGIAYRSGAVFALAGNLTLELWVYDCARDSWLLTTSLPLAGGQSVGPGGSLVVADADSALYAFKGNGTLEFYRLFPLAVERLPPTTNGATAAARVASSPSCLLRITPDPLSAATTVTWSLTKPGPICLKLYDAAGRQVATLATGYRNAGSYSLALVRGHDPESNDGFGSCPLTRGVYLLTLNADGLRVTRKLIVE